MAQPITLSFLRKYPTYDDAKKTSFAEFKRFLSENHYPQPRRAQVIYEKLQQPHLECEDMLVRTKSRLMLTTVSQLQILMDEIEACMRRQLGEDWGSYQRALTFYNECLSDMDHE